MTAPVVRTNRSLFRLIVAILAFLAVLIIGFVIALDSTLHPGTERTLIGIGFIATAIGGFALLLVP
jgi:hypothetical protein